MSEGRKNIECKYFQEWQNGSVSMKIMMIMHCIYRHLSQHSRHLNIQGRVENSNNKNSRISDQHEVFPKSKTFRLIGYRRKLTITLKFEKRCKRTRFWSFDKNFVNQMLWHRSHPNLTPFYIFIYPPLLPQHTDWAQTFTVTMLLLRTVETIITLTFRTMFSVSRSDQVRSSVMWTPGNFMLITVPLAHLLFCLTVLYVPRLVFPMLTDRLLPWQQWYSCRNNGNESGLRLQTVMLHTWQTKH